MTCRIREAGCGARAAFRVGAAALLLLSPGIGQTRLGKDTVLVVTSPNIEAFVWVTDEVKTRVARAGGTTVLQNAQGGESQGLRDAVARYTPCLIVAVGTEAARAVRALHIDTPVILSMVLEAGLAPEKRPIEMRTIAVVPLDVPATKVFRSLKRLFPGRTRVGVIRNPERNDPSAAVLREQAQSCGLTVVVEECSRAEDLLSVFNRFAGAVDFVWTFPDSSLYNSITVRPLVMSSLKHRLPIVGFSESFAKSGAAFAIYPDFHSIGAETGEMAARFLRSEAVGGPNPAPAHVALNQNILRMLGLRCALPVEDKEVSVIQ